MKEIENKELVAENQQVNPEGLAENPDRGSTQPSRGSGHEEVFDGSERNEAVRRSQIRHARGTLPPTRLDHRTTTWHHRTHGHPALFEFLDSPEECQVAVLRVTRAIEPPRRRSPHPKISSSVQVCFNVMQGLDHRAVGVPRDQRLQQRGVASGDVRVVVRLGEQPAQQELVFTPEANVRSDASGAGRARGRRR